MLDRITVRMSPDLIARIDEWIGDRPFYVSRQEAVRRLVSFALDHGCPFETEETEPGAERSEPSSGPPRAYPA